MLIEAVVYALSLPATPAPFRAHLGDAVGLWARGHRQQHRAWRPHLLRTRAAIERITAPLPGTGTLVVLGSGALFDVPLAILAAHFRAVVLVDHAHLIGTRHAARRHGNVTLAWRELSAATTAQPLEFLSHIADLEAVVSVNLLSQLAFGAPEGGEPEVIDAHLEALAALSCPATLITDLRYETFDRAGCHVDRLDLLYGRPMPLSAESWSWEVAPFGEDSPETRRVHEVAVFPDWRRVRSP